MPIGPVSRITMWVMSNRPRRWRDRGVHRRAGPRRQPQHRSALRRSERRRQFIGETKSDSTGSTVRDDPTQRSGGAHHHHRWMVTADGDAGHRRCQERAEDRHCDQDPVDHRQIQPDAAQITAWIGEQRDRAEHGDDGQADGGNHGSVGSVSVSGSDQCRISGVSAPRPTTSRGWRRPWCPRARAPVGSSPDDAALVWPRPSPRPA